MASVPTVLKWFLVLVSTLGVPVLDAQANWPLQDRSYCRNRRGTKCCPGRQDDCNMPILDTLCYCDDFCQRSTSTDCCPDYRPYCLNESPPLPLTQGCRYNDKYYAVGKSIQFNCNKCTCQVVSPGQSEMMCEERPCLVRPEILQRVNEGDFGWKATNYSFFWGKTLEEGYSQRVGICKPEVPVLDMTSVSSEQSVFLEEHFDARRQWPGLVQPIRDQLESPASWAISTVDVAADRLAIQTNGEERPTLSPQNIMDCVARRKNNCNNFSPDRAWWYLRTFGTVPEDCYPYLGGGNGHKHHCKVPRNTKSDMTKCPSGKEDSMVYRTPPAYRVNSEEDAIMSEIKAYGPVQAILKVKEDFFAYKSGVYRHINTRNLTGSHHHHPHFQAVRILGWGIDRSQRRPLKYWLCANSWGPQWGENGYFRIVRGIDECDIEMFVVGVWAKKNRPGSSRPSSYSNYIY